MRKRQSPDFWLDFTLGSRHSGGLSGALLVRYISDKLITYFLLRVSLGGSSTRNESRSRVSMLGLPSALRYCPQRVEESPPLRPTGNATAFSVP